ncbi:hypothetical protein RS030_203200 [Cryptosporidium xiaoi]|uniref:SET domain-containing protein n=1 Tax=Cryptosporidium xiaoi TaxID=659607 RepID=A0AAV9XXP5_9CRYT
MWDIPEKLKIVDDKTKGRCIIAKEDIEQGELIIREIPYCYILFKEYSNLMCNFCFRYFSEKVNFIECKECGKVKYCSKNCLEESRLIHEIECSILTLNIIDEIAIEVGVTYDRTLLLLRFLIKSIIELTSNSCYKANSVNNCLIPNYNQISILEDNMFKFPEETLEVYRRLSNSLINIPVISEKIKNNNLNNKLNENLLLRIMCIIDSNSFGIPIFSLLNNKGHDDGCLYNPRLNFIPNNSLELTFSLLSPNITGWGLFSFSSLFNHSCDPNCGFIGVNNSLYDNNNNINGLYIDLIANKKIKKNEEICISYIEMYDTRRNRIKHLSQTKYFFCQCNRCSVEFNFSKDKYIEGFLCSKCFDNSLSLLENTDSNLNMDNTLLFSKSINELYKSTSLSSIVDDSEYLIFQLTNTYECENCKETFFGSEITKVINEFNNAISEAERLNNEMCNLSSAVELLINIVDKYFNNDDPNITVKPHPMNYLFYRCYKLIAFWSIILGEWNHVDKYVSFMINSQIFVTNNNVNNVDISNLYATKGVALYNLNRFSESEDAWSRCKLIRKICCSINHPLYSLIPLKFFS